MGKESLFHGFPREENSSPRDLMNGESLVEKSRGERRATSLPSSIVLTTPEFKRLLEWVRLTVARIKNNLPCIEQHQQLLRALGETDKRLNALDHWRQSSVFTEREKAALRLSEIISRNEPAEFPLVDLKTVRGHFSIAETVHLALAVMAVNDWIAVREKEQSHFVLTSQ